MRFEYGPYVNLSTTISGNVNLGLIKGGVYGTLNLVELNVKTLSVVRLDVSPDTRFLSAYFKSSVPWELNAMSGALGLAVDAKVPSVHWHKKWRVRYPTVHWNWERLADVELTQFPALYSLTEDLLSFERWYYRN